MRLSLGSAVLLAGLAGVAAADDYVVDGAHAAVYFKVSHAGISSTFGRFNDIGGTFTFDAEDLARSKFGLTIKAASIDTGNAKRDEHLRSPDFFNVKQFPALTFKSTEVKAAKNAYQVTGDLTLHGVTKSITFPLTGGKTTEFPKGVKRIGFSTELTLQRSDFSMDKMLEAIGDDITISISLEGTKK